MKFYWAPNSRSFRILWLLEELGRPYERVLIDIRKGEQNRSGYDAVNPLRKVPALEDDGQLVSESGAIALFASERVPEVGLAPPPGDPQRGDFLRWLFFEAGCIEPAYAQKGKGWEIDKMSAAWGSFDLVIDVLERALREGPWLLGDRFTAADVMVASDLWYGIHLFKIVEARPALTAYVDRCAAREAFKRAQKIDDEAAAG